MTAIRVISTIALIGYFALFLVVSRDARRRDVRAFTLFLLSMLVWQIGVTAVSFTQNPTYALYGYRVVVGLGGTFGLFYALFSRDFLGVRSHKWIIRAGCVFSAVIALWTLLGIPGVFTGIYQSPVSDLLLPSFGPVAYLSACRLLWLSRIQRNPADSISSVFARPLSRATVSGIC